MHRTQAVKNKKKTSSNKVNKTKGAKFESSDKINSNGIQHKKIDQIKASPPIEVQGQSRTVSHIPHPIESVNFGDRKLERANSFFLTRQLTKIYDSLTNSKESLKDNDNGKKVESKMPFKFMRSVSLAAISLKKDYRTSMRKSKLEQLPKLSEEDHTFFTQSKEKSKPNSCNESITCSVDNLSNRAFDKSSVISSFKRTFSLTPSRRKTTNPKWSASLMSLQQIDVMISYEDLSFIDYDKFNTYEENLMSKIKSTNQIADVNRANIERFPPVKMRPRSSNIVPHQRRHSMASSHSNQTDEHTSNWSNVQSKRWSNPCYIPNVETVSMPLCTSDGTVQPSLGVDECDCSANINTNNLIESKGNLKNAPHSVDDLTEKPNNTEDLLLQSVSAVDTHLFISLSAFHSNWRLCICVGFGFDFCFFFYHLKLGYKKLVIYVSILIMVWVSV